MIESSFFIVTFLSILGDLILADNIADELCQGLGGLDLGSVIEYRAVPHVALGGEKAGGDDPSVAKAYPDPRHRAFRGGLYKLALIVFDLFFKS